MEEPKPAAPSPMDQKKTDPVTAIRSQYKVGGGACTLVLVGANNAEYGRITQFMPRRNYMAAIRKHIAPVPEIIRIARANKLPELTAYLEENPDRVNTADAFGRTALAVAVEKNNTQMVQLLLENRARPNQRSDEGIVPLMLWSQRNQKKTEMGELLLKYGAAIDAHDLTGKTALMHALQRNAPDTAKFLLSRGARPNTCDKTGKSPLMYAAEGRNAEIVQILCNKGARVNMPDFQNNTALHAAAMVPADNSAVITCLLKNRARKNAVNNQKKTPKDVARNPRNKALL